MQSAATLPEAAELLATFRTHTLNQVLEHLTTDGPPPLVLRNALDGQVHQLILTAFGAALLAAQQADPDL